MLPLGHEIAGARLVGQVSSSDLVEVWSKVCSGVIKHGFVIEYRDLEPPRTGIFDGLRIVIDPDVGLWGFMLSLLVGASFSMLSEWLTPPDESEWLSEGAFLVVVVMMSIIALCGLTSTLRVRESR